jgi:hypothetical protein
MSNYILWLRHLGREVKLLKEEAITIVATRARVVDSYNERLDATRFWAFL